MGYYAEDVIKIARGEKGYLEKATKSDLDSKTGNAGKNNYTKYARDLDAISFFNGRKQGAAWCAVFVAWSFYKAFGKSPALSLLCQPSNTKNNCGAGCKYIYQYFKAKGQWHTSNPKPGDVIVFYDSSKSSYAHTGLVYKVDGSYVYTIEGNTSTASGVVANGGGVAEKKYKLDYDRIVGYGRPKFGVKTSTSTTTTITTITDTKSYQCIHTVVKGNTLWSISTKHLGRGNRYKEIMELNGMTSDKIKPGMKLKIPMK